MQNKFFMRRVLHPLIFRLIVAFFFVAFLLILSTGAAAQNPTLGQSSPKEARIEFWNRVIAVQRGTVAGTTPEDRAERASEKLAATPVKRFCGRNPNPAR